MVFAMENMPLQKNSILLLPPFDREHQLETSTPVFSPYHPSVGFNRQRPVLDILERDLRTPIIDKIYPHLWLAGLPKAARPLHRQVLLGRNVIITENPNEHLVWNTSRIFIKPLPEYLLSHDFWTKESNLLTRDRSIYQCACGMLLSYCWLICTKSDLFIAQDAHLLPSSITWKKWVPFMTDLLTSIDCETLHLVSQRYHFGELRLSRLDLIYRLTPSVFSVKNFIHGYMSESLWSKAFIERNFAWLFSVFGFVTIVAGSMQVGLGTSSLQNDEGFQGASVVFTAASLIGAVASVILVGAIWGFLTVYHVFRAKRNLHIVRETRLKKSNEQRLTV